jgi:hypothetical protein
LWPSRIEAHSSGSSGGCSGCPAVHPADRDEARVSTSGPVNRVAGLV